MSRLDEVGDADGWRCWICDQPVDASMSVNDPRGPSVDSVTAKPDKKAPVPERLAHRACNTRKGAVAAVVPWPDQLFVADPAPIIASVDRLARKGGREIMGRCTTRPDAQEVADWLVDRIARLRPGLAVSASIDAGGGQFLVVLSAPR